MGSAPASSQPPAAALASHASSCTPSIVAVRCSQRSVVLTRTATTGALRALTLIGYAGVHAGWQEKRPGDLRNSFAPSARNGGFCQFNSTTV